MGGISYNRFKCTIQPYCVARLEDGSGEIYYKRSPDWNPSEIPEFHIFMVPTFLFLLIMVAVRKYGQGKRGKRDVCSY